MDILADRSFLTGGNDGGRLRGSFSTDRVLAPLLPLEPPSPAYRTHASVAAGLARCHDATLLVLDLGGADGTPVEVDPDDLLDRLESDDFGADADFGGEDAAGMDRGAVRTVVRAVDTHDVDTVTLQSRRSPSSRPLLLPPTERLAHAVPCDSIVVNGSPAAGRISSILLPIAGGPHSGMAVDIAGCIASDMGAWVDVLHVVDRAPGGHTREGERYVATARERLADLERVDTWTLEADDVAEAIIEQSHYYDMTIIGAPSKGRLQQFIFGSTTNEIRTEAGNTVLMVRDGGS